MHKKGGPVPGEEHEVPLKLLRNAPHVVPALLERMTGHPLPEHEEVLLSSAECTDSKPRTYTADGAVVLRGDGRNITAVVVEHQNGWDADKYWTWPVYLTTVRAQLKCPTYLLALCPTDELAGKFSGVIPLADPGSRVSPIVMGPAHMPVVVDPEQARAMPELTVFSARAHADREPRTLDALFTALRTIVDQDRRAFYHDYVMVGLGEAALEQLEGLMSVDTQKWQSEFARTHAARGREESREEALVQSVLSVLNARGLTVPDSARERIENCRDIPTLETWVERAVTVESPDDLFA